VVKEAPVVNEVHKTIGYELLKGAVTALVGTGILTTFDIFGKTPWVFYLYDGTYVQLPTPHAGRAASCSNALTSE
jgi:hypothetical protein